MTDEEKRVRNLKINSTKQQNNSYNTSNPEEKFYLNLVRLYGEEDIIRQYNSERYPFNCDFYIKSKDLFIELNLNWTHGTHPFDEQNPNDLQKLQHWQENAKTSSYYKNAIDVWTRRDPLKFKIAKENNLNYIVIYNEIELFNYFNNN